MVFANLFSGSSVFRSSRAQSSLEFLILLTFLLLVFSSFFLVGQNLLVRNNEVQTQLELERIAVQIRDELLVANQVHEGYARQFTLPDLANDEPYSVEIIDGVEIVVNTSDYEHIEFLPLKVTVVGLPSGVLGTNIQINKEGAQIDLLPWDFIPCSADNECDDGNVCTQNICSDAGTPGASCTNPPLDQCTDDDTCCPSGCNAASDNDCSALCGNQVLEPSEECEFVTDPSFSVTITGKSEGVSANDLSVSYSSGAYLASVSLSVDYSFLIDPSRKSIAITRSGSEDAVEYMTFSDGVWSGSATGTSETQYSFSFTPASYSVDDSCLSVGKGFIAGTLGCTNSCVVNTGACLDCSFCDEIDYCASPWTDLESECVNTCSRSACESCGDGFVSGAEVCDTNGPVLPSGSDCTSYSTRFNPYIYGEVSCSAGCGSIDATQCKTCAACADSSVCSDTNLLYECFANSCSTIYPCAGGGKTCTEDCSNNGVCNPVCYSDSRCSNDPDCSFS